MSYKSHDQRNIERLLRELVARMNSVENDLCRLIQFELFPRPTHIHSSFGGNMPVTLAVGQTVVETITESNAAGHVAVVGANITVVSSDPTIATVVDNGDGTATWTAVAPGTVTSTFSDTKFNLSGTDTLTVEAAAPTSIASSFGTPV